MATFKDLEDNLRNFIVQEQSDAHNVKSVNVAKYGNLKLRIDSKKYKQGHFIVRISISEAVFDLASCNKIAGGLGYEERFISKWYNRYGVKEKLLDLWHSAQTDK